MEMQFSPFFNLMAFLSFFWLVPKILKSRKNNNKSPCPPPGPWKLPIVGNMHLLTGSLPHQRLSELAKKYGPLMRLQLGEVTHVVISSPETAKEVLKTHDLNFVHRPRLLSSRVISYNYTNIAFAPYGDYWRQMRKICMFELLSSKHVQSHRSTREEMTLDLVKSISSEAESLINLSKMIFSLANRITSKVAFGLEFKVHETFMLTTQKIIEVGGGFSIADFFPSVKVLELISGMSSEIKRVHQEADSILQSIVDEHIARKLTQKAGEDEADDIVDVLLHLKEHGNLEFPLTIDSIKSVILDIILGGSETSSTTIDWAMSELLKNPRAMSKAQAEVRQVFGSQGNVSETGIHQLEYLKLVIKETLRLHPPLPLLLPRECKERCEINGYEIPAKSKVVINAWAIGRDPRHWTDPESFNPERFLDSAIDYKGTDFEFIPFGAGRRNCPGISFGIANVELPLAQLLYHFDWKLPGGIKHENFDMSETFGATVRRKEDLYLIPFPYHPPPLVD